MGIDGKYSVLLAMSNGLLKGMDLNLTDPDSLAHVNFETWVSEAINSPLIIEGNQVFFVDGTDYQNFNTSGSQIQTAQPLFAEFNDLLINEGIPVNPAFNLDYVAKINEEQFVSSSVENSNTDFTLFNINEEEITIINTFRTDSIIGQFSIADIDGNGTTDIVYLTKNSLNANNLNGTAVINFPVYPILADDEYLVGTPLIVDLSGQGDIIIILSSNKGQVTAFNKDGKVVDGFPFSAGGTFSSTPVILQIDDDSALELATVSNAQNISVWEIPGSNASSKIIWGMTNLNSQNNSVFHEVYTVEQVGKGLIPKSRFFNYPNPNEGSFTTIRYYLNEDSKVTIRIFDTSGYKVDQFSGPGVANTENEIVWNVDNFSSGVYVCQLEAVSDNFTERKLIKIMVVH